MYELSYDMIIFVIVGARGRGGEKKRESQSHRQNLGGYKERRRVLLLLFVVSRYVMKITN